MTNELLQQVMGSNMQPLFVAVTILCWITVTAYWIITSKETSDNHRGAEIFSFIKLIGSSLIIYFPLLTGGFIAKALFNSSLPISFIGLLFCISGIGVMIWARRCLDKNWSGNVILQEGHTITTDGPYRWVRHPIYGGGLLAMLGSALIVGQIFGFVWLMFCTFGLVRKAKQEEALLSGRFSAEYSIYKTRTKLLIPFIW